MTNRRRPMKEPDRDMILLGQVIRDCRRARNEPQAALASQAQMDESYLSLVENGRYSITLRKLLDLCEALDYLPEDILSEFSKRRIERDNIT